MAVLTVEISEKLLTQLQQTGRPAQEVVIEIVEQAFSNVAPKEEDLSPDEVIQRLRAAGFIREPEVYDSPEVQEWLALPDEERKKITQEMDEMYFPDSPASQFIIENR